LDNNTSGGEASVPTKVYWVSLNGFYLINKVKVWVKFRKDKLTIADRTSFAKAIDFDEV
jgi:hypothetical protein